jgi:hypothetical protein
MPIIYSPLELLASFLVVFVISALATLALTWLVDRSTRQTSGTA